MSDEYLEEQLLDFTEIKEIAMPTLSVNVDFNQLLHDYDENQTFAIIKRLKELLQ